jgi:putative membrane protein
VRRNRSSIDAKAMTTKKITSTKQLLSYKQKNNIALFLALLFHACGAIGILFTSYKQWFINNTPVNLVLMMALLLFTQKQKNIFFYAFVVLCFFTGLITEIIGVNTGALFGQYAYGDVLGIKVLGVPLLIGVNWFIAVFCSCNVIFLLNEWLYKKLSTDMHPSLAVQLFAFVTDAALLTMLFDYILEPTAIQLGFWRWLPDGSVPLFNFVCWFIISAVLSAVFRLMKFDKHNQFAVHLLIIQLLFFLVLQTFL